MTITDWLDQAQARAAVAAPGPWEHSGRNGVHTKRGACVALSHRSNDQRRWDDAEFIAAARTDLPAAITALREALRYLDDPNERLMGHSSPAVYVEPLRHAIATALGATP